MTSGQMDWLQMMYDDDTYQTMLSTFGRLVEEKVLPAEQNTEVYRAKNPLQDLKSRLEEKGKFDEKTVDDAIAEAKKAGKIPQDVYDAIVESGLTGVSFSEELDGLGLPYPMFMAFLETLGKASPSVGVRYAISNTVAEGLRFNHASGDLSAYGKNILRELVAGTKLAAFCLTEVSAAGSNIMREMLTTAVPSPDGKNYTLTGNKMWITNVETADVYAIFAKTSDDPKHGVSLFLVEKGTEGFGVGQIFEKRIVENSSFGELILNEVKVPVENLVGKVGEGVQCGMRMLNSGRITIAALATGLAQRAFDEYMEVAVEGKKIAGRQLIDYDRTKERIAEMSMEINAARDMTYRAAWLKERFDSDSGNPDFLREYVIASNGAKLKASLVAQRTCENLIKIWGASSVVKENSSMKHYLDSWLYYFGEAVPEVLENTVANMEAKKYRIRKGL